MQDLEHGFSATADELAQVLRAAGSQLVNSAETTEQFYHGVLMGAASAMIMGMRNAGAENTPIEIEIMPEAFDGDGDE